MLALSVDQLSVRSHQTLRLDHLSFTVPQGSRLAIIGPNGAGKSTLLQALLKLIPSTHQSLTCFGQNIDQLSRKALAQLISYVPQMQPDLAVTVFDWCSYGRMPHQSLGFSLTDQEQSLIHTMLARTNLTHFANTPLNHLSGGERQRAMIAASLCQETPLILLDEPTNFLDPKQAHELLSLMRDIATSLNKTILAVTHDVNEVTHYFTDCLALKAGKICFMGEVQDVVHQQNLERLYDRPFIKAVSEQGVIFW
ncbi:Iron(3+)-hydroxamate import ATP-binding protein FhuC [Wohlfahrtiimonas chitiniclastica SH04]|uniref:Iron(3+)-hydroxamate import ATP-binding protein FhuC n=1 Tax=Wohlfahrtiimonas chitiniclastica SH04 TaxID=1261130 RepID=L8XYB1_9GAMM|nr:ABC transporter ATP-binding protein [Wohlfahrtiimonas chitiniclastica]ELV08993.1 Iron(3+)-hydroxamate import ATP-binding protein FhuC [Wohlfahrtiimonas chitiniclastica SH04]